MIARPGALLNVLANTLRDGNSLLTVGIRQQQTKFLASQSGKDVVIANAVFDNIHDRQNHAIPHKMAPVIVYRLKVVDVQHHNAGPLFCPERADPRKCLIKIFTVVDLSKRIAINPIAENFQQVKDMEH